VVTIISEEHVAYIFTVDEGSNTFLRNAVDHLQVGMSIDVKFYVEIVGDHIDIKSFYRFRKFLFAPTPN
jgi:hypothetical protein